MAIERRLSPSLAGIVLSTPFFRPRHCSIVLTLLLALLATTACDDGASATLAVNPGEHIPGLWRPTAITFDPQGRLYVVEQASQRLRRFDGESWETLLDVNPLRTDTLTFPARRFDTEFGRGLLWLPDGQLLIASANGPLLVVDLDSQKAALEIAGTLPPAAGQSLGETQLEGLQGITLGFDDTLYLAINDLIWRAPLTSSTGPIPLAEAQLEHLAGTGTRALGPDHGLALDSPLLLGSWAALVADPDGGLYFTELNRLRYLRGGYLMTLTGEGSQTGIGDLDAVNNLQHSHEFEDFYGNFGDWTQGIWYRGAAYFLDNRYLRRFEIQRILPSTGDVDGQVISAVPYGLPEVSGLAAKGDTLYFANGWLGTILSYRRLANDYEIVFGADSWRPRYEITSDDYLPFAIDQLLNPQSAVPLYQGELFIANQPLSQLLMAYERDSGLASAFLSDNSPKQGGYDAIASDGAYQLYVGDGSTLSPFTLPANDGESIQSPGSLVLFRSHELSGIPGQAHTLLLSNPLEVRSTTSELLFFDPTAASLYALSFDTALAQLETGPRSGVSGISAEDESAPFFSLDLASLSSWEMAPSHPGCHQVLGVLDDPLGDGDLLVASNSCGEDESIWVAGVEIPRKQAVRLAGGGGAPLALGVDPRTLQLDHIGALALDDQARLLLAVEDKAQARWHILSLDEAAAGPQLDAIPGCETAPAAIHWISALDEQWPPQSLAVIAQASDEAAATLWIWRDTEAELAALGAHTLEPGWNEIGQVYGQRANRSETWLSWLEAKDSGLSLQRAELAQRGQDQPLEESIDLAATEVLDWGLSQETFFGVIQTNDAYQIAATRLGTSAAPFGEVARAPELSTWIGGGTGFATETTLAQLRPGMDLRTLAVARDGDLLFALGDSASLWRLHLGENGAIDLDDTVTLVAQGATLFEAATPSPIADDGEQIWLGRGTSLFALQQGASPTQYQGKQAPALGMDISEVDWGHIRGLCYWEDRLYLLSDRYLLGIEAGAVREILATDSVIEVAGERYRLDFETLVQPALTRGRPGELVLAHPASHQLLSVTIGE